MSQKNFAFIRLLRPEQWVKNSFVCLGLVFGGRPITQALVQQVLLAVVAFSLVGSAVYTFNDYIDRHSDREHPAKRSRPIASGEISRRQAISLAISCALLGFGAAIVASVRVFELLGVYVAINIAYSLRLKHYAVIDVFCIALGFMLRILAGTWGVSIAPSGWLMLTGMFLTLFMGFAKRRVEWVEADGAIRRRPVLGDYSQLLLDVFLAITASGFVLSYGVYTRDLQTAVLHQTSNLIYTVPLVLFGTFRYLLIVYTYNRGENPLTVVFADKQMLICGAAYAASVVWILHGNS